MPSFLETVIGPIPAAGLAAVGVAVILAGFIRGFVGFGAALIIVMVLSVVIGPQAAVPIACLSGLPSMAQLLPNAFRHAERAFVVPFGLATFAAAPLGTWLLVSIEPAFMKIAISVFVLAMVAMLHRGWQLTRATPITLAGAGAAAGFIQGASSAGGPPAVAVALSRPGTAQQQRANVIGAVSALNICALAPFWYYGLFTRDVLVLSLVIVPLYTGSTWFGARFFTQRGQRYFRNAALLTLALVGIVTLALALQDYLALKA